MKIKLLLAILFLAFFSSGCIYLLAGAAGAAVYTAGKNNTKRKPHLTEMQRRAIECKEIEGEKEDVLRATVAVFQDRGYSIQSSDYQGGIIVASSEKPFLQVTSAVEEFIKNRIKLRITMKDKDGIIEDAKAFTTLFDDIQTEVFRRNNLR